MIISTQESTYVATTDKLEENVNSYLNTLHSKGMELVDIKYSTSNNGNHFASALIIYRPINSNSSLRI